MFNLILNNIIKPESRHLLLRAAAFGVVAVILFATAGIHFIHPYFHSDEMKWSYLASGNSSADRSTYQGKDDCPICKFLKQFHVSKSPDIILATRCADVFAYLSLLNSDVLKDAVISILLPRAPPILYFSHILVFLFVNSLLSLSVCYSQKRMLIRMIWTVKSSN